MAVIVRDRMVMASMVIGNEVMPYTPMAYIVVAYTVMACIVTAYAVVAYTVMAYIGITYEVMTDTYGLYRTYASVTISRSRACDHLRASTPVYERACMHVRG